MADIKDVLAKEVELQATVDGVQAAISSILAGNKETVDALNAKVAELQALVDAGATPAEFQAAIDGIQAIQDDVATTVPTPAA